MRNLYRFAVVILFFCLSACSSDQDQQYLGYIEGRYTYLSSQTAGHLSELPIYKGEEVTQGQLAFVLDPEPELSQLKQAKATYEAENHRLADLEKPQRNTVLNQLEANIRLAQSKVDFSKKMYERDVALRKQAAISQAQLDQSKSEYLVNVATLKSAEAALAEGSLGARLDAIAAQKSRVDAAKANVSHLEWLLSQKKIMVPQTGVIENTFYRIGEFVAAGKPVASLLVPDNRYVVFYVAQKDRSQLKIGQTVHFTCDGCAKSVAAKVAFIATRAEYTPPVIYSKDSRDKLVYYVEADMTPAIAKRFQPGQPIQVMLDHQ